MVSKKIKLSMLSLLLMSITLSVAASGGSAIVRYVPEASRYVSTLSGQYIKTQLGKAIVDLQSKSNVLQKNVSQLAHMFGKSTDDLAKKAVQGAQDKKVMQQLLSQLEKKVAYGEDLLNRNNAIFKNYSLLETKVAQKINQLKDSQREVKKLQSRLKGGLVASIIACGATAKAYGDYLLSSINPEPAMYEKASKQLSHVYTSIRNNPAKTTLAATTVVGSLVAVRYMKLKRATATKYQKNIDSEVKVSFNDIVKFSKGDLILTVRNLRQAGCTKSDIEKIDFSGFSKGNVAYIKSQLSA